MEKIDEALVNLRQNSTDGKRQSEFYDLILNSSFFVPVLSDGEEQGESGGVIPMITEADGNEYMMLFSTVERLQAWDADCSYIEVPGHILAVSSIPPLHWALNVDTDYSKQFHPEEIGWLRQCVEHCNAEAAGGQQA